MGSKTTHVCLNIQGALAQRSLDGILEADGRPHSDAEARMILNQMWNRGFTYFVGSVCDRIGPDGSCQGHRYEEISGEEIEITQPTGITQEWKIPEPANQLSLL